MLRSDKDEAGIVGGAVRWRVARRHAWSHRRRGTCIANQWRARLMTSRSLGVGLKAGASGNTVEEARLVADWRGSQSCGCERSREAIRGAESGGGTHRQAEP